MRLLSRQLLDKGADVNAKFRYGTTALFKAAERGHFEVAKVLIERGVDVKVKDTFYQATAMTWALDGKPRERCASVAGEGSGRSRRRVDDREFVRVIRSL